MEGTSKNREKQEVKEKSAELRVLVIEAREQEAWDRVERDIKAWKKVC